MVKATLSHLICFLTASIQSSSNTRSQVGGSSSIPSTLDGSSDGFLSSYYRTTVSSYSISSKVQVYLRYFTTDPAPAGNKTYTSAYQVVVDEYSQLVVPDSTKLLVPDSYTDGMTRKMSLLIYQTNQNTGVKTVVCSPTPRNMFVHNGATDYAVQYRSILITVSQGIIVGCDWAPSSCVLQPSSFAVDSICADACTGGSCKYNITMFISWTGTDRSGTAMTSYNRDMYRLVNAFS